MLRHTIKAGLKGGTKSGIKVRSFHIDAVSYAANPKAPERKPFNPSLHRKKGQKGANKTFFEYVNSKRFKDRAGGVFDTPAFENTQVLKLVGNARGEGNKIFKFNDKAIAKLSHLGSFKKAQFNELFSTNVSLVRNETLQVITHLEQNYDQDSSCNKFVLFGESGIGKSTMLAQVENYLINKDAIVIAISNSKEIIEGSYEYSQNSNTKLYEQPTYLKKLLTKTYKANKDLLSQIPLSNTYSYNTIKLNKGTNTLYDLLATGVSSKVPKFLYPNVFKNFIEELQQQSSHPVYVAVDDFNALTESAFSDYRLPDFNKMLVDKLQVAKFLFDLCSDKVKFKKGGLILSTSATYRVTKSLSVPFGLDKYNPFDHKEEFYQPYADYLTTGSKFRVVNVEKLPKEDVKELVNFYLDSGLIIEQDKEFVEDEGLNLNKLNDQKYFLSGNGNPRELIKACNLLY